MKPIYAVPATLALVYRAYSRKSLTPNAIVVAALTAIIHAIHPWSAPFVLLVVFFLGGTAVTKVKHDVKSRLTISASSAGGGNGSGGEGPRTAVQVLANSGVASILILLRVWLVRATPAEDGQCFAHNGSVVNMLDVGIIANYAAVAADTFSSELGILSGTKPRLITSPTLREVPPGTNGGVTLFGTVAGAMGACLIGLSSAAFLPFCPPTGLEDGWDWKEKGVLVLVVTGWGGLGSLLDSFLGGLLQASVVDKRSGKVVEGSGGQKVLVHPGSVKSTATSSGPEGITAATNQRKAGEDTEHESRKVESGHDILDNNAVNVLMAAIMSGGAVFLAGYVWEIPLGAITLGA